MVYRLDYLPEEFLDASASRITDFCHGPTLIDLPGKQSLPVFVSILQHGNEPVGLQAIQRLLRRYPDQRLPRRLLIFVGNVEAATKGKRFLSDQVDFNRAWPGSELPHSPTHDLLAEVTREATSGGLFASIDLHNNTGVNPIYSCICSLEAEHLELAAMFSRTVIYFTRPKGVQTRAFTPYCPSVTCECGKIGNATGIDRAADLIDACLHKREFAGKLPPAGDVQVYHTVARIRVSQGCQVGFHADGHQPGGDSLQDGIDILLREDLDQLNFRQLEAGEHLGTLHTKLADCFEVDDDHGRDVTDRYLRINENQVFLNRPAMPSMFTRDADIIRQDCLGYLMEELRDYRK